MRTTRLWTAFNHAERKGMNPCAHTQREARLLFMYLREIRHEYGTPHKAQGRRPWSSELTVQTTQLLEPLSHVQMGEPCRKVI